MNKLHNLPASQRHPWLLTYTPSTTQQSTPFDLGYNLADPYGFGLSFDPIGAFYETVTPANDLAPSIADKTPVLVAANNQGLTVAALTAKDINYDGKLSGTELNNLNIWIDANENGHLDANELNTQTQGNAVSGAGIVAAPARPVLVMSHVITNSDVVRVRRAANDDLWRMAA